MNDRKTAILKQLELGEITADQALAMLNQVPENTPPPKTDHNQRHTEEHTANPSWIDGLANWVENVTGEVIDSVRDWDFDISDILDSGHKRNEFFESSLLDQGIKSLTIVGKNARVEVHGYDGNTVKIECKINARYHNANIYLHEENGHIELVFEQKQMRSVAVECYVPHVLVKELIIENKNSKIVASNLNIGSADIRTTNGQIKIKNIRGNVANLTTTNSSIKVEEIDINHLRLKTTNAGLKFKENFFAENAWTAERVIEATTTNSGVRFKIDSEVNLYINATTRNGRFVVDHEHMHYNQDSKNHIECSSSGYDHARKKLRLEVSTTNASVKVL